MNLRSNTPLGCMAGSAFNPCHSRSATAAKTDWGNITHFPFVIRLLMGWVMLALAAPVLAQLPSERMALVIGNAAYSGKDELKNPVNDAQDMAVELRKLGFSVIVGTNLDEAAMNNALAKFYRQLAGARESLALVYFAGHGSMERERNYLWPIGAEKQLDGFVYHAYALEDILRKMHEDEGHRGPKVMIIDACRINSRNLTRGPMRGLAVKPSAGTLIGVAAAPGQTALDNPGERNGLYTKHLLERLRAERGSLQAVLRDAGNAVYRATGGSQTPQMQLNAGADTDVFYSALWPDKSTDQQAAEIERLRVELEKKSAEINELRRQQTNVAGDHDPSPAAELTRLERERQQILTELGKRSMPTYQPPPLPVGVSLCTSNISLVDVDTDLLNTGTALVASFVDSSGKSRGIHLPNVFSYTYREFSYIHYAVEPLPGTYVGSAASGDSVMLTVQAGPKLTEFQTALNVQTHRGTFNVVPLYREMDACPFEKGLVVAFLPNKAGHAFLIIRANAQQEIAGYLLARANRQEEIVLLQFRANRIGR